MTITNATPIDMKLAEMTSADAKSFAMKLSAKMIFAEAASFDD